MNEGESLRAVEQEFSIGRRGSYAQSFTRPVVDLIGNGIKLLLAVAREVSSFGQVLTHMSLVFSLEPHFHGLCGLQKYTDISA